MVKVVSLQKGCMTKYENSKEIKVDPYEYLVKMGDNLYGLFIGSSEGINVDKIIHGEVHGYGYKVK